MPIPQPLRVVYYNICAVVRSTLFIQRSAITNRHRQTKPNSPTADDTISSASLDEEGKRKARVGVCVCVLSTFIHGMTSM